jgi:hypothetical protein
MTSGRHDGSSVAILFFTHVFDRTALRHLNQLKDQSGKHGTLFVYCDADGQEPPPLSVNVVTFDFPTIRQTYPRILGTTLVPGNCHLTLLDFAKRYPQFQHYWVIEYDVEFAGRWEEFFNAFAGQPADFVATHLRDRSDEPDWFWWSSVEAPPGTRPIDLIRAFCPIQRVSRSSLELLEASVREGWVGHFECLVPSLLKAHGFSLLDIGGNGRYVIPGAENRYYTSFSWRDGELMYFGSMRFRPEIRTAPSRRNTLYHPVKSIPTGTALAPRWAGLKDKISYVTRQLARHPIAFSRALGGLSSTRSANRRSETG